MADLVPVRRAGSAPARTEDRSPNPPPDAWPERRPDPFFAPFREFDELWDRMVSRFFAGAGAGWPQGWTPPADIEETPDEWIFRVELPGASRDDLRVELADAELAISGEVREPQRSGVIRHRGRRTGSFAYRTTLPPGVDPDRVQAQFENGVLTVRVPRPEQSKPRRIKIG
jgi:HSP20 family protein